MNLPSALATASLAIALLAPLPAGAAEPHGVPLSGRDVVRASVQGADDIDTYVFDAAAGSRLRVILRPGRGSALDPHMALVGPSGVALPAGAAERRRGARVTWRDVVLPATGRYALGVAGRAGTSGAYEARVEVRAPQGLRFGGVPVAGGSTADLGYAAPSGSSARIALRADRAFEVLALRGSGPGPEAFSWSPDGTRARARVEHTGALQDRAVTLRAPGGTVHVSGRIRVVAPRGPRERVDVTRPEPVAFAVQPEGALPGARVAVVGDGFLVGAGAPVVMFGSVRGLDAETVAPDRIEVTVPAGSGVAAVTVFDADGLDARVPRLFHFDAVRWEPVPVAPLAGILGLWDFTATAGPLVPDLSGNGFNGRTSGTPGLGKGGLALPGDDSHVVYGTTAAALPPALANLTSGTITVRFRYDDVLNGVQTVDCLPLLYYGVDAPAAAAGSLDSLAVYIGHTGIEQHDHRQIYFTVIRGDRVQLCFDSGTHSLEAGRWYHYAVTIAPGSHHGYLDGVEFVREYNSGTSQASDAFFATAAPRATRFTTGHGMLGLTRRFWSFNGAIAEVRIYDRVLSSAEIAVLARQTTVE